MVQGGLSEWVKAHKKSFARKVVRDAGVTKVAQPTGIFMAGLPGAGKTEFTKSLIANLGIKVVRLDMDEIAAQIESYTPQKADKFRGAASALLSCTFDKVVHGGYDFIMDGTLAGKSACQDIDRALAHGYDVKIFYIYQNPRVAWEYTVAREKIEHRSIELEGFIDSYYRTITNLKEINDKLGDKVPLDLVIKGDRNEIIEVKPNINMSEIDNLVDIEYNKDNLRKLICEQN